MPFVMLLLKKTTVSFAVAAVTVIGTQIGKVIWDKGLKKFTEEAASDIFSEEDDEGSE